MISVTCRCLSGCFPLLPISPNALKHLYDIIYNHHWVRALEVVCRCRSATADSMTGECGRASLTGSFISCLSPVAIPPAGTMPISEALWALIGSRKGRRRRQEVWCRSADVSGIRSGETAFWSVFTLTQLSSEEQTQWGVTCLRWRWVCFTSDRWDTAGKRHVSV